LDNSAPVLVLGFNRPESLEQVFRSLSNSKPSRVLVAIDGPRDGVAADFSKVLAAQESILKIDWKCKIETRFRKQNLGIRKGIPDAVSWAIDKYGHTIVIEDDLIPGPDFYEYMQNSLEKFESDLSVGHLSGYNLVPKRFITNQNSIYRKSIYPMSYAWGTWSRAWKNYSDEIDFKSLDLQELSYLEKSVWKKYFEMSERDLVSTWAFRWISSLWNNSLYCVSPNRNISNYIGNENGTHTRRKPKYSELEVESIENLESTPIHRLDHFADEWTSRTLYKSSFLGNIDVRLNLLALNIIKKVKK
jgi:hypothetical protein